MPLTRTPVLSRLSGSSPTGHQPSRLLAPADNLPRVPDQQPRGSTKNSAGPVGFPVVGMVGGGQLARMAQPAAVALGVRLRVLAESADSSAAQVVPDAPVGDHRDAVAVRAFAARSDVLTFDHEHVPTDLLRALEADGVAVRPGSQALMHAQDKGVMRARLSALGLPVPRWRLVPDADGLRAFAAEVGLPLVLKTPRGGYDGKGVLVVRDLADAGEWLER